MLLFFSSCERCQIEQNVARNPNLRKHSAKRGFPVLAKVRRRCLSVKTVRLFSVGIVRPNFTNLPNILFTIVANWYLHQQINYVRQVVTTVTTLMESARTVSSVSAGTVLKSFTNRAKRETTSFWRWRSLNNWQQSWPSLKEKRLSSLTVLSLITRFKIPSTALPWPHHHRYCHQHQLALHQISWPMSPSHRLKRPK